MKKKRIKLDTLDKIIDKNKRSINREIFIERESFPKTERNRIRSNDEREALTKITDMTVKRAMKEGKIKLIGERKLYYDATE